jgi:glutathione S-transferase
MLKLYGTLESGNCYKVRLALHQLDIPFGWIEIDILEGESRTAAFLARNPNGRVPVLELEDGACLSESNAILWYLAEGTALLPEGRLDRGRVLQWMCFEQYSHEPFIATSRFYLHFLRDPDGHAELLAAKREPGYAALSVMERHLSESRWMVGPSYTIADIALYAYTHVAHEGGFDLGEYPAVRAWLGRVAGQPGHSLITSV